MRITTLLLAAALHAQPPLAPVPASGSVTCAWSNGWQLGDANVSCDVPMCLWRDLWHFDPSECWLTGYCAEADERVGMPPNPNGFHYPNSVVIGSTMYWQTANVDASLTPIANGYAAVFFVLSDHDGDVPKAFPPEAAPGWNAVFGEHHVPVMPEWVTTQTSGGYTFDSHVLSVAIPYDPTLVGTVLHCQGARFDATGFFYLSSAYAAQIGL